MRARFARYAAWTGAIFVCGLVLTVLTLATGPGQRLLLDTAARLASAPGARVVIGGFEGSLFSAGRLAWIEVGDARGVWLRLEGVSYRWRPLAAVLGRIEVAKLIVEKAHMRRQPDVPPSVGSRHQTSGRSLVEVLPMTLGEARVDDLHLAAEVLGMPARLKATARVQAANPEEGLEADIAVMRIDGRDGVAKAQVHFAPARRRLRLDISANEAPDGLLAAVLQLPDRPAMSASVRGDGGLDDWRGVVAIDGGPRARLDGEITIGLQDKGHAFSLALHGEPAALAPAGVRDLAAGRVTVRLAGHYTETEHLVVREGLVTSEALRLEVTGVADLGRRFVHGEATLALGRDDGGVVRLPFGGEAVVLRKGMARVVLEAKAADRSVRFSAEASELASAQVRMARLVMSGSGFQPAPFDKTWAVVDNGQLEVVGEGINASDPAISRAVGSSVAAKLLGHSTTDRVVVERLTVTAGALSAVASGLVKGGQVEGEARCTISDLAAFSDLAGQALGGRLIVEARGRASVDGGASSGRIEALLENGKTGIGALDELIKSGAKLAADVGVRADGSVTLGEGRLSGQGLAGNFAGTAGTAGAKLSLDVTVAELERARMHVGGGLHLKGDLETSGRRIDGRLVLAGQTLTWRERRIDPATVTADLSGTTDAPMAKIAVDLGHDGLRGAGQFSLGLAAGGLPQVSNVDIGFGRNRITGGLKVEPGGLVSGELQAKLAALEDFSRMAGLPLRGQGSVKIASVSRGGRKVLQLTGQASGVVADRVRIEGMDLSGALDGSLGTGNLTSNLTLRRAVLGELALSRTTLEMTRRTGEDGITARLDARAAQGTLSLVARAVARSNAVEVSATQGEVNWSGAALRLTRSAKMMLDTATRTVRTDGIELAADGGRIAITGQASDRDSQLRIEIAALPARVIGVLAPELGLAGKLGGRIGVSGPASMPRLGYDLTWTDASASSLQQAGIAPVVIAAQGNWAANTLIATGKVSGRDGLNFGFNGQVRPGQANALDMRGKGDVPLAALLAPLAERGTRGTGLVRVQVAASGALARPALAGSIGLEGGSIKDDATGLRLHDIRLAARLVGDGIAIDKLEALTRSGGRITGRGQVDLDPERGLPASLRIEAKDVRFDDKTMLAGLVDGGVDITGPLARSPSVSGTLRLGRVDVTIPEQLPRSIADLDIRHVGLSPDARQTLGLDDAEVRDGPEVAVGIDVKVVSPGQFFVRGRGVDAELSGDLHLTGSSAKPLANGQFRLRRGSMTLLGRRLALSRGTIGFAGQLDPVLDLEATSEADGVTISVMLAGRASAPKLSFASSPSLPEDEILARLLFNKALTRLSPLQIAQLATEVDRLGGLTSGPGMIDGLRKSIGVDRLDVTTDAKGNAAVSAGSNLSDQLYVGVQQNVGTNASRVVIDLDITKHVKARGEAGSDGNSKLGIGVEWNY